MWDQPIEPTLVGAPIGHPEGSFSINAGGGGGSGQQLWGAGGSSSGKNVPPAGSKMENWGGGGVGAKQSSQAQWNGSGSGQMKDGSTTANGWDQTAAGGGSSWVGGGQAPANSQPVPWNGPTVGTGGSNNAQWGESSSPSGPSSWSQIASKNVVQQQQQQAQQPQAVRPKSSYDSGSSNWGAATVDQETPWGGAPGNTSVTRMSNEWSNTNGGANSWEHGSSNSNNKDNSSSWGANQQGMQQQQKEAAAAGAYWKSNGGGGGAGGGGAPGPDPRRPTNVQNNSGQWNNETAAGASGWDSLPPTPSRSWNPEQQQTPSNVWTGPPSAQESAVDSSMIWNNPNPKKIAQPDKGTNVWGDPTSQNEIKRWKTQGDGDVVAQQSALQQHQSTSTPSSATSGGGGSIWKDSPIAPQQSQQQGQKTPSGAGWNDSSPSDAAAAVNGAMLWDQASAGKQAAWGTDNQWGSSKGTCLNKSMSWTGQIATDELNSHPSGFLSLSHSQAEINQRTSGNSENENGVTDDVFSPGATTPIPHLKNGMSAANYASLAQMKANKCLPPVASNPNQLQALTKHITDQLKTAVQAGLIDPNILNNHLPTDTIIRVNHLLQYIPKLEQAQREMQALTNLQRTSQLNGAQAQELQRLSAEIRQYQMAIQTTKSQISAQTTFLNNKTRTSPPGGQNDTLTSNGSPPSSGSGESLNQSKLLQWKNGSSNGEDVEKKLSVSSPSATNLENLVQSMASLGMNGVDNDPWSKKSGPEWPSTPNDSSKHENSLNEKSHQNENQSGKDIDEISGRSGDSSNASGDFCGLKSSSSTCMTPTNILDEGPPEFRPGQKWLWRDPKEVADDPNATPGSIKPSVLNTNLSVSGGNSFGSFHQGGGSGSSYFGAGMGGNSSMGFGKANSFDFKSAPFGGSDAYFGSRSGGSNGRLPSASQLGQHQQQQQSFGSGRPPLIKQQYSVPNSFVPFGGGSNVGSGQWIVLSLTNMSQVDEQMLQMLVNRMGTTQSYVSPPGRGVAFVKFRDVPFELVLSRMQQDFPPLGVTVQSMKESEVERFLGSFNVGQRQPSQMFNPNVGAHGPPPPMSMMWDSPPPGHWGAGGGGGAASGGAPPMPFGNLPPIPDQMAQMMQQPQMHDGTGGMNLFGGPQQDRLF